MKEVLKELYVFSKYDTTKDLITIGKKLLSSSIDAAKEYQTEWNFYRLLLEYTKPDKSIYYNLNNKFSQNTELQKKFDFAIQNAFSCKNIKRLYNEIKNNNGFNFNKHIKNFIELNIDEEDIYPWDYEYLSEFFNKIILEFFKKNFPDLAEKSIIETIYDNNNNSFQHMIIHSELPLTIDNAIHYRNEYIPLTGRNEEIKWIQEFLNETNNPILWTAITGQAGSGKSKLMYHFTTHNELHKGWKVVWFFKNDLQNCLNKYSKQWFYPKNLLIVVDDVDDKAELLGEFIESLSTTDNQNRPDKVRIIILDRHEIISDSITHSILNSWYNDLIGSSRQDTIEELEYKFLTLKGFNNNEAQETCKIIITNYAKFSNSGSTILSEKQIDDILKKTKIIEKVNTDNHSIRPLILILVTESYLSGNTFDSIDGILAKLLEKEKKNWKRFERNNIYSSKDIENILAYATFIDGLQIKKIEDNSNPFKDSVNKIFSDHSDNLNILIKTLNCNNIQSNILKAIEPDMVGEFFILTYLYSILDEYSVKNIINFLWENYPNQFYNVISRCIDDFYYKFKDQYIFANGLINLAPSKNNPDSLIFFSKLLLDQISKLNKHEIFKIKECFTIFQSKHPKSLGIAVLYAKALLNFYIIQCNNNEYTEELNNVITIELETIYKEFCNSNEIAEIYSRGLLVLSLIQTKKGNLQNAKDNIENDLANLHQKFATSIDIAKYYAKGLCLISLPYYIKKSNFEKAKNIAINILKSIHYTFINSMEIAEDYSTALIIISFQDVVTLNLEDKKEIVKKELKSLHCSFPASVKIGEEYAEGLYRLSVFLLEEGYPKESNNCINGEIKSLNIRFSNSETIAKYYAKGLYNLHVFQRNNNKTEVATSIVTNELKSLYQQFPKSLCIAEQYTKGLYNVFKIQEKLEDYNVNDNIVTNELKLLHLNFINSINISEIYAMGLYDLSLDQLKIKKITMAQDIIIKEIMPLHISYPNSIKISENYGKGLFNTLKSQIDSNKYDEKDDFVINELKLLFFNCPNSVNIGEIYAKALNCLFNYQIKFNKLDEAKETISCKLKNIHQSLSKSDLIAEQYAKGLSNLAGIQIKNRLIDEAKTIITKELKNLYLTFPKSVSVAFYYGSGLYNLFNIEENEISIFDDLESLYLTFPKSIEIIELYARGLSLKSNYQVNHNNFEDLKKSFEKIKTLFEFNPTSVVIAEQYSRFLYNLLPLQKIDEFEMNQNLINDNIKKIHLSFPKSIKIARLYANELYALSYYQIMEGNLEQSRKIVTEELKNLHQKYYKSIEIAEQYAKGLVNLSIYVERKEAETLIKKDLKYVSDCFPTSVIITQYLQAGFSILNQKK